MSGFTESVVEQAALAWLEASGWKTAHGPDIAPDIAAAERREYAEVLLAQRLRAALARLNPGLPTDALEDAFASAQLFQILLAEAERQGTGDVASLRRLERSGRWTGAR